MKKRITKFTKVLLLLAMIFSNLMTPISVFAEQTSAEPTRGDLGVNGIVSDKAIVSTPSYTTQKNDGEVQIIKTVSKLANEEGKYNVEFTVKGEKIETLKQKDTYVVLLFDTSNSMICGDGFVEKMSSSTIDYDYQMADGTKIRCSDGYYYDSDLLTQDKWENAVNAAVQFGTEFAKIDNQYISLVNFGGRATTATDFISKADLEESQTSLLEASHFHYVTDGTNMEAALKEAERKLEEITDPEAQKYILMIGDGMPTVKDSYNLNAVDATKKVANSIKLLGIEIFTIGYGLDATTDAHEVLQYVSSDYIVSKENGKITTTYQNLGYHTKASISNEENDNIKNILDMMLQKLGELKNTGTSAVITDNIGDNFKIVNSDGSLSEDRSIELEVGEITPEGTKKSFVVQIDENLESNWYDVNKGFVLNYKNYKEEDATPIVYSEELNQPQVYWEKNNYKINYYKDSLQGELLASEEGYAKNGTTIDTDDFDEYKHLPTEGYELKTSNINPSSITLTNNGEVKEINVVYTKTKHTYEVNYYYDDIYEKTNTLNATYGTKINSSTFHTNIEKTGYVLDSEKSLVEEFTIIDNTTVINVYFKKGAYDYSVKYYFNGQEDTNLYKNPAAEATYGTVVNASDYFLTFNELNSLNRGNYYLDTTNPNYKPNITINTSNNLLEIYYINSTLTNEDMEKTSTTSVITNSNQEVFYKINYSVDATNIKEGSTITTTIVDTLPYKIEESKSDLNNGIYNSNDNTITWTITEKINSFTTNKTIAKEINYKVVYKDFEKLSSEQNNNLTNSVNGKTVIDINSTTTGDETTSEGVTDTKDIPVNIKGSLEVLYVDENGNNLKTITQPEDKPVGTIYTTSQETIYGYTFNKVEKYINDDFVDNTTSGEYVEGKTLIKYTYTKNNGTVDTNKVTKTGPEKVKSINDTFTYTLTYEGKILEYAGDATLVLTDTPDFKVKELVSGTDSRCILNNENKIICEETYEITETNKTINDTFIIKVKYENITDSSVGNTVEALLKYGNVEAPGEASSTKTEVKTGNLKVIHNLVDNEGNILETLKETTTEQLGGTPYTTQKEESYGYSFDSIIGQATGVYIADSTITVEYRYTKNIGTSEETLEKIGNNEVDSINSKFDYTITYETIITDYKGNAKLTIIDLLPYQIDLEKSTFNKNDCTYSYKDGKATITCIYEKSIDQENQKINVLENLSLYYIDVKENGITNKVESILTYGETTKEDEYQFTTEVKEGKVKVNYVTIKNNEYQKLTDEVVIEGMIDYTYETEEKEFPNYILKEVIGEPTGIFTEEEIEVTYVYEKVTPPKTGVQAPISNGVGYINYVLILLVGLVCKKRYN